MKEIISIFFILIIYNNIFGQQLEGKFTEDSDFIEFNNDSVDFKMCSNGGLKVDLYGNGIYKITDEFLLIETFDFKGSGSHNKKIKNEGKSLLFTILDKNNTAIAGVSITLTDKNGKHLSGTVTDKNGQASILKNKSAYKISLSLVGYDNYTIDYSDTFNYIVNLMDYETIENSIVVFKINSINPDNLNLILLSTDFSGNIERKSDLQKLEKKSNKYKYRKRLLKK